MKIRILGLFLCSILLGVSCKKDDPAPEPEPQPVTPVPSKKVSLQFKHMADTSVLAFDKFYPNHLNQNFSINKFRYYISNVELVKSDNSVYRVPESYYLLDHAVPASLNFELTVPQSTYRSISFMLGVDSTRNVSGAQKGALDQANDMFWTWNSGYIFLKLEGSSPSSGDADHDLTFHIGGYKGTNKTQRTYFFDLGSDDSAADKNITLGFVTNVSEIFRSPEDIDFATTYHIMTGGSSANKIANNYKDMFTYTGPIK